MKFIGFSCVNSHLVPEAANEAVLAGFCSSLNCFVLRCTVFECLPARKDWLLLKITYRDLNAAPMRRAVRDYANKEIAEEQSLPIVGSGMIKSLNSVWGSVFKLN
jgi:hypothetical protein